MKYDWERRFKCLVRQCGRYLIDQLAKEGTTHCRVLLVHRGVKLRISHRRNAKQNWTAIQIWDPRDRNLVVELKNQEVLSVSNFTTYLGDFKKMYKQLERTIYNQLEETQAVEILQSADDNYNWGY